MELDNNAVWALIGTHLIQWLKSTNLVSQIDEKTDVLNQFLGLLWAFVTGLGLTIATQGNIMEGMILTANIPSLSILVKNFLLNWGMQQTYYHKVLKKKT